MMDKTILKSFDHKICRSCGQSFIGKNTVCESCLTSFQDLEEELKSHEHVDKLRHCKYCGRPFIGGYYQKRGNTTFFQPTIKSFCKGIAGDQIHYSQCQNCGGSIAESTASGEWPKKVGCSRKCTNVIWQIRKKKTTLERYGVEHATQSESIQAKMRSTCQERYGVDHVLQRGAKRDEIDAAMRKKFGVESNISQNPDVRKKINATMEERYGGFGLASEIFKERYHQTSLARYGTFYPHQSDEIKQRIHEGLIRAHANSIENPIHRTNYLIFIEHPTEYILNNFDHKPTLHEVSQSIGGFDESTIYEYIGAGKSKELFSFTYSKMEDEMFQFLSSITSTKIVSQDRQVIKPKELDFYLPEYNLGIECNPTSSHNSSLPFITDDTSQVMPYTYHLLKSDLCTAKGVFLFHVFGYEWHHKNAIIKSMIANLLEACTSRYYARDLHVEEISNVECNNFLDRNHRQQSASAKIRLGLRTNEGNLVSVMTFGHTRSGIGGKSTDTDKTFELIRFCSLLNTSVVGGASKLFKYFIRNFEFDKIISFSDKAHTKGNLYEKLGFESVSVSSPNYVWVNMDTDIAYNRVSCQKKNLPRLLNEPDLDIENQTEKMIMMSHGFVQVFDSGTIRWEYTDKERS